MSNPDYYNIFQDTKTNQLLKNLLKKKKASQTGNIRGLLKPTNTHYSLQEYLKYLKDKQDQSKKQVTPSLPTLQDSHPLPVHGQTQVRQLHCHQAQEIQYRAAQHPKENSTALRGQRQGKPFHSSNRLEDKNRELLADRLVAVLHREGGPHPPGRPQPRGQGGLAGQGNPPPQAQVRRTRNAEQTLVRKHAQARPRKRGVVTGT